MYGFLLFFYGVHWFYYFFDTITPFQNFAQTH